MFNQSTHSHTPSLSLSQPVKYIYGSKYKNLLDTKGINGLSSLQSAIEEHSPSIISALAADSSLRASLTPSEKYRRGKDFFASIYSRHTDRILSSMRSSS